MSAQDLSVGYKRRRRANVVASVPQLALPRGQLVCLLGPNGAGKSTLMRTLAGMQPPLAGRICLDGQALNRLSPRQIARLISVVLTERIDTGLLPAYGVVALGRYPYTDWQGRLGERDQQVVRQAMIQVGAAELAERPLGELSDGERQKVLIARALAQEPALMLLDEPTAFLDLPRRVEIMQILRRLAHDQGCAVLLSTHDLDLALRSADQIWLLNRGKLRSGSPEDLVLDGSFAATFASEGVAFDLESGSFSVARPVGPAIAVQGEGSRRIWTERALTRAGYHLVDLPADSQVPTVICHDEEWQVVEEGVNYPVGDITELLARLAKHRQLAETPLLR